MKKYILIAIVIRFLSVSLFAQPSAQGKLDGDVTFTLEGCIQYAEEHNYTLQRSALNITSSEIDLKQAKENIAPTVSANANQGFGANNYQKSTSLNGNYGISANMSLFNGLSNYNNIQQSKLQVEQSNLELEQSKNSIRISIIQAFLNIMMNEDLLDYQQEVLKSSRQQLAQGEQQYRVGQILESEYKMLKAQCTSDEYNVENTKISIQNNYLALKDLLSINPALEIRIVRPDSATLFKSLAIPALDEVINRCTAYLPALKISENNITEAEYGVKMQKANYYPSLSLGAGVSTGYNNQYLQGAVNNNTGWGTQLWHGLGENVNLSLSIPIYSRGNTRHNVQQAQLRVQQAELSKRETENQIHRELQQYYLDVLSAQNNYLVAEAQKEAYEANFKTYSFKFQYGSVTVVDLIQQQTNYLNQLNRYMQAKYAFVLDRKILDVYMGEPVRF